MVLEARGAGSSVSKESCLQRVAENEEWTGDRPRGEKSHRVDYRGKIKRQRGKWSPQKRKSMKDV